MSTSLLRLCSIFSACVMHVSWSWMSCYWLPILLLRSCCIYSATCQLSEQNSEQNLNWNFIRNSQNFVWKFQRPPPNFRRNSQEILEIWEFCTRSAVPPCREVHVGRGCMQRGFRSTRMWCCTVVRCRSNCPLNSIWIESNLTECTVEHILLTNMDELIRNASDWTSHIKQSN